jgi:hypothetical protein
MSVTVIYNFQAVQGKAADLLESCNKAASSARRSMVAKASTFTKATMTLTGL